MPGKFLLTLLFLCSMHHAFANSMETVGTSAQNLAIGHSGSANPNIGYRPFYNAALLAETDSAEAHIDSMFSIVQLPTTKVPDGDTSRSNRLDDNATHLNFDLSVPVVPDLIGLGISGSLLSNHLAVISTTSSKEPFYFRYGSRQQRPALYAGTGVSLSEGFSIGLGSYLGAKASGRINMTLAQDNTEGTLQLNVDPIFVPTFSMYYRPINSTGGSLGFALNYREEQAEPSTINLDLLIDLNRGSLPVSLANSLIAYYDPRQVSFGMHYDLKTVAFSAQIERSYWSRYRSPVLTLSGDLIERSQDDEPTRKPLLQDRNTFRFGAELEPIAFLNLRTTPRLGLEYAKSAVKPGQESSPLRDSDKTTLATGFGIQFPGLDNRTQKLKLDIGASYSWLTAPQGGTSSIRSGKNIPLSKNQRGSFTVASAGLGYDF